ncbi:ElyC/SanA/YdcF family protein [Streptomyces sp. NPDC088785]|uniref:ElyC/SanA/YdcF family protein n=1 Tax=Streptomyces sp. NPDC088785 TaxID=3365897 RepID=UPI003827757E
MIFSGGATSSGATEARLMADYAKSVLAFDGAMLLEDRSATTWENITMCEPATAAREQSGAFAPRSLAWSTSCSRGHTGQVKRSSAIPAAKVVPSAASIRRNEPVRRESA